MEFINYNVISASVLRQIRITWASDVQVELGKRQVTTSKENSGQKVSSR